MDDARYNRKPTKTSPAANPSTIYSAALLGVATFLILFVSFSEPIRQYTVRVELEQEVLAEVNTANAVAFITVDKVDQVAEELLTTADPAITYRAAVEPVNENKTRVQIEIAARRAADAMTLSQAIADRIIATQPTSFVPRAEEQRSLREDVLRRLSLTQDSERSLNDELNKLEREHFAQALAQMRELAASQTQINSTKPELSDLALAWQAARGRLQELENRRAELLITRTNSHPLVQEINYQLEEQLATMARLPNEAAPANNTSVRKSPTFDKFQQNLNEYQTRSAELLANRDNIRSRRENLEAELMRLSQPLPSISLRTAISSPASIIERAGGRPNKWSLTMMLLAAVVAAGVTYYGAQRMTLQPTAQSIEQVQRDLGLPIVTVLKVGRPHFREQRELEWLRSAVFSAELLLLGLAVAILFAFASVHQLSQPASEDPFGVVAEAFDRMGETTVRR